MNAVADIYTMPEQAELLAGAALSSPFHFTMFSDTKARTKMGKRADLIALAKQVAQTEAAEKNALSLVSLGRYGDVKSEHGSLRHQKNLSEVYGLEADYDAGDMPPAEAAQRLAEARIAALIYTSPSHGLPGKGHRWRVVCPFSGKVSPRERERHVARLNGVLEGVLARESFTLSQSYFIGGISGREPETFLVDGTHIDSRADLDAEAVYARTSEPGESVSSPGNWSLEDLRDALFTVPSDSEYEIWWRCLAAVHHETGGSKRGLAIAEAWSACGNKWKAGEVHAKWRSFGERDGTAVAAGTLFHHARANGWEGPTEDFDEDFDALPDRDDPDAETAFLLGHAAEPKKTGNLTFRTPDDCVGEAPRGYVVKGLIAPGQIGCIFGDPGAGKSLIGPSIGYAIAQGRGTFGLRTKGAPVFYIAAEDEEGMGWRVKALRTVHGSAQNFKLVGGVSNLLAKEAPDLKELRQAVKRDRPGLIVIDTLSLAFPGLEENSAEGMGRVVAVARALTKWGAAVMLIHHGTKAEGNTPRGHSLLNGALDVALHLSAKDRNGIVRGKLTKNRNGSCDLDIAFTIGVHRFGLDEDGDEIEAVYAEELAPGAAKRMPRMNATERALLAVFARLADGSARVERTPLRDAALADTAVSSSDSPDSRKRAFNRALQELVRKNLIELDGEHVTLLTGTDDLDGELDHLDEKGGDP